MPSNESLRLKESIISKLTQFMMNCQVIEPIGQYIYLVSTASSDCDIDQVGVYTKESEMIEEVEKGDRDLERVFGWKIRIDDINSANLFEKKHPQYEKREIGKYDDGELGVCFYD